MRVIREQFIENEHSMNGYLQLGPRSVDFINNKIPFYITVGKTKAKKKNKISREEEEVEYTDNEGEYNSDNICENYDIEDDK